MHRNGAQGGLAPSQIKEYTRTRRVDKLVTLPYGGYGLWPF